MKVLAIVGTSRKKGVISTICENILQGAKENGNDTELVNLYDYEVNYCVGCWGCATRGKCIYEDDFEELYNKMQTADVVILASPVYWSGVTGITKNMFDRMTGYGMNLPEGANQFCNLSLSEKFKTMITCAKNFGGKEEIAHKRCILVTACTAPFPMSHISREIPNTLYTMKMFAKKLNGKVICRVVYTDTLFKLRKNKYSRIMKRSYFIGKRI